MFQLLLWASLAVAQEFTGRDEFGRSCALRTTARLSVLVEGEWYDGRNEIRPNKLAATVYARRGGEAGEAGELEIFLVGGRPSWFRLSLPSATGYAHACWIGR